MKLSPEHTLAIKMALLLLLGASFLLSGLYLLRANDLFWFLGHGNTKYIVFPILSVFIYAISYTLASLTIAPIKEHNEKLKSYNHHLAHELKTPLSVISTNLELLEMNYDSELVLSSKEEILHLKNIIDSLLFLSEKNTIQNPKKVSLTALLKECDVCNIDLELASDWVILWNTTLLKTLLHNLIENARKYHLPNTKIHLNLKQNALSLQNTIQKNITQTPNALFEPFVQWDNAQERGEWYGLWLAIVEKIAKIHGLKVHISLKDNIFEVCVER